MALRDVSLRIAAGEVVGLVGPSGAGKSSLLHVLNGTVRPTAGLVRLHGHDVSTLSARELRAVRHGIGTIHQDLRLVPNLRVIHNVLAGGLGRQSVWGALRLLVSPPRPATRRAHELLQRVGMAERLYERTDRLSGGEQQRVAVARALYQEPLALLADEPVSSVDPARAREILALLVDLARASDATLVTSLHNLDLARALLPRLIGLRAGRIAFDRPTESLSEADFRALYDLDADIETNAHS